MPLASAPRMHAAVITRPGGPEVLELREVPRPEPGVEQVLVRVRATALNRADLLQREGRYPAPPGVPTDIPGIELAGEVAAVGPGVQRWREGDRVFGIVGGGAHAEYAVAHERALAAIPGALSWREAGAVPEAFITAHDALVTQAAVRPCETVLVHAVGSGVGLAAVQLARAFTAVPYGTSRTPEKLDRARDLGMADGLVPDAALREIAERAAAWTDGRGVDVVLDLVGGPYLEASVHALAPRGRLILVGTVAGAESTLPLRRVLGRRLTIRGTVLRARPLEERILATRAFESEVVPLLAAGRLRPVIHAERPLAEIAGAHRLLASNETTGKVVLVVAA